MDEYIKKEDIEQKIQDGLNNLVLGYDAIEVLGMIYEMPAANVAPVRHGSIIETIEDGRMKRVFSCCGTDFTQMTCWMIPKYCPECGAILRR